MAHEQSSCFVASALEEDARLVQQLMSPLLTRITFGQILHINSSASVLPEAISPSPASPELHSYWLMSTYFPTSKTMVHVLLLWKVQIISQSCEAQNNSWGCHRCQQLSTARRDSWSARTTTLHSKSCCCSNSDQGMPAAYQIYQ